ncbi:MAG: hypothetical protein IKN47_00530 [Lachnospiraceae bacterium]|nr:hypothetical protein [Lachnospiraceae bacterium]
MKKFLALVLVGVMAIGTAVFAAPSPSASTVSGSEATVSSSSSSSSNSNASLEQVAKEDNMSVAEELNNALVDADPGVAKEDAITAGIPQGTVINGVMTAYSIRLRRATKAQIDAGNKFAVKGKKFRRALRLKNKPAGSVTFNVYLPQGADGVVAYQFISGQAVQLTTAVVAPNKLAIAVTTDAPIYLYK